MASAVDAWLDDTGAGLEQGGPDMTDGIRLDSIDTALERLRRGEAVIVVDDEDRENEGDFVMAAEKVTPEAINFLSKHGRGLICLARRRGSGSGARRCGRWSRDNTAALGTAFTVSVDAASGHRRRASPRTTGRARCRSSSTRPPARRTSPARATSSRSRRSPAACCSAAGHTEAVVDLCRLAGLYPAGVLCEIMDDDGIDGAAAAPARDRGRALASRWCRSPT